MFAEYDRAQALSIDLNFLALTISPE